MANEIKNTVNDVYTTTTQVNTNEPGHFYYTVTTTKNGHQKLESDEVTQELTPGNQQNFVRGNSVQDVRGNISVASSGFSEQVVNSQYTIIGSPWMLNMHSQEHADEAQMKYKAMQWQPDEVPDTSIMSGVVDALIPKFDICVTPSADELQDAIDMAPKTPTTPETDTVFIAVENAAVEATAVLGVCATKAAKELTKLQLSYPKDKIMKVIESRIKMLENLPVPSQEAFQKNMGKALFPGDGNLSIKNILGGVSNLASIMSNPMSLVSACLSPSSKNAPKTKNYNPDNVTEAAGKAAQEALRSEINCS